eukprot:10558382-Karenia_brevis.AAC.1
MASMKACSSLLAAIAKSSSLSIGTMARSPCKVSEERLAMMLLEEVGREGGLRPGEGPAQAQLNMSPSTRRHVIMTHKLTLVK